MLILGLSGGRFLPQEVTYVVPHYQHDSAAVLIDDGRVVAAIEEERLNRIKHTNRAPLYAPRFCLDTHGVTARDIDHVAFYLDDAKLDEAARHVFLLDPTVPVRRGARSTLGELWARHLGIDLPPERVHFVPHHLAHAVSAFALSGFDRSLVVTIDAEGDYQSGLVARGGPGGVLTPVATFPIADSLGYLYQEVIPFLGYKIFDEYKVMGLAPYGDPERFREAFAALYTLLPEGAWRLHRDKVIELDRVMTPRRKGEPFTQAHQDFAAALQQTIETIVFHMLTHYRQATGERRLCLAGGVAHNCSLNGRILASGLFDEVFVQPAAHDAGAALGAALHVHLAETQRRTRRASAHTDGRANGRANGHANGHANGQANEHPNGHSTGHADASGHAPALVIPRLEHLYWGSDIGSDAHIARTLEGWAPLLSFERVDDICGRAAALMADGQVLGWAQGRSEFGPRALGNRSIVADPRPAAHKALINAMVKKREAYRPFAPSVLVEDAADYFVLPPGTTELPYMIVVVGVRPEKRALLGAVTHVDGSARVQTVSQRTNPRYWRLIHAFKAITGVPIVLNTSFNNNVEPIVDSAEDAVVCFLTTKLHYLAVGDWLVRKAEVPPAALLDFAIGLPPHYRLIRTKGVGMDWQVDDRCQLARTYDPWHPLEISPAMYDLLQGADGRRTARDLCGSSADASDEGAALVRELWDLWALRAVRLRPPTATAMAAPTATPVAARTEAFA